jgi:hypothetical protein
MVILLLACFPQLDVVRNAPAPTLSPTSAMAPAELALRLQKERELESFSNNVISVMMGVINQHDLKMVAGMINLCLERWDLKTVLATRVSGSGIAETPKSGTDCSILAWTCFDDVSSCSRYYPETRWCQQSYGSFRP